MMEEIARKPEYYAKAFVSCSLRDEDRPFVDFVCSILKAYRIQPFGTVGKFYAAPENPVVSMDKNISNADIVVICATPRYIQQDVHNGKESQGLSEMIHVETGMAYAYDKPVVAFVEKGTNVGGAIPNITQYVELTGAEADFKENENKITSLLNNAYRCYKNKLYQRRNNIAVAARNKETTEMWATIGKIAVFAIATYAIIKFFNDNK